MDKIEVSQRAREAAADLWIAVDDDFVTPSILQEADRYRRGDYDQTPAVQAFARFERDILVTRTDATPVAVEMVAELQLSAFLAGRGSIRTKANGNTHESSPGPTMDDYRRMARFALAEGQVDATPVAWMPIESAPHDEPILAAIKVNHKNGHSWWERHIIVIDSETGTISDMDFHHGWEAEDYECWQPLPAAPDATYTHPPATDVAALVEAAKDNRFYIDCEFDGHNGPLLSMAIVRDDEYSIHMRIAQEAKDPWVRKNVMPLMDQHNAVQSGIVYINDVGGVIRAFLGDCINPVIIADSPVDIGRFCQALSTAPDGGWASADYPRMTFEVHNVDCYPTDLPNAIQHNAWWDAMALRQALAPFTKGQNDE